MNEWMNEWRNERATRCGSLPAACLTLLRLMAKMAVETTNTGEIERGREWKGGERVKRVGGREIALRSMKKNNHQHHLFSVLPAAVVQHTSIFVVAKSGQLQQQRYAQQQQQQQQLSTMTIRIYAYTYTRILWNLTATDGNAEAFGLGQLTDDDFWRLPAINGCAQLPLPSLPLPNSLLFIRW